MGFPIVLWQVWGFIAPGLYKHEKKKAIPFVFLMSVCFIGGGVFATLVTLFYVTTIDRWSSETRINGLFILSGASYALIALLTAPFIGLEGPGASLAIYAWCSGMSPLMIVQTWSWSSKLLDVRLARRLFPITSALATIGAAAGGAATRGVVQFGGITTLISLAAILAWVAAIYTKRASRLVPKLVPQDSGFIDIVNLEKKKTKKRSVFGDLPDAFRALNKIPLLGRLALLTFLVQAASVVLDFQFSSALKNGFADVRLMFEELDPSTEPDPDECHLVPIDECMSQYRQFKRNARAEARAAAVGPGPGDEDELAALTGSGETNLPSWHEITKEGAEGEGRKQWEQAVIRAPLPLSPPASARGRD